MSMSFVRRMLAILVVLTVSLPFGPATTASVPTYDYDAHAISRVDVRAVGAVKAGPAQVSVVREGSASASADSRVVSMTLSAPVVATNTADGARFVVNSAGDALDTARVTIPGGKYSHLLEYSSKAGVFADSMGFNQASLDSALRSHLVDNFRTVGPSGAKWTITSAWGVDVDVTIRLITATP